MQIYWEIFQWKIFNRLRFHRIMVMSLWPRFFGPSCLRAVPRSNRVQSFLRGPSDRHNSLAVVSQWCARSWRASVGTASRWRRRDRSEATSALLAAAEVSGGGTGHPVTDCWLCWTYSAAAVAAASRLGRCSAVGDGVASFDDDRRCHCTEHCGHRPPSSAAVAAGRSLARTVRVEPT